MSKVAGKKTYIAVSSPLVSGGGYIDISDHVDNASYGLTGESFEVGGMGSDDMEYIPGRKGGTFQISGAYDDGVTGPREVLKPSLATEVDLIYRPEGTGSTLPEDTFAAILVAYDETSAVASRKEWSATLTITNAVTTGSQS